MDVGAALVLDDRHHGPDTVDADLRGAGGVRDGGDDLQRGPEAGCARQRDSVPAEVERLLNRAGIQDWHADRGERGLGGAGKGRGLGGRVVAGEGDQAAACAGADEVAVAKGVGGTVNARRLAVPPADDAVDGRLRLSWRELRAPDGGCAELLVERGLVMDVEVVEVRSDPLQLLVVAAEGRALVARDHAPGPQAGGAVGAHLVERDADQRLNPAQVDAAGVQLVLVGEGDRARSGTAVGRLSDRHRPNGKRT